MDLLQVLSEGEIARFHARTEDLLATVGMKVAHAGLRERCRKAGARVDEARETVCFPPQLLRELVALAPASYAIRGVNGLEHTIGGEAQWLHAIVTDPWIIDYETQQPRRPCLADLRRHTIIAQRLPEVVAISRMDFPVTDVPGPASSLRALEEHLLLQTKHVYVYAASQEGFEQGLEIGRLLAQGQDLAEARVISVAVPVVSPLTLPEQNCEWLLTACAQNLPVLSTICPMAGSTGPYSLAGMLLLANAENLAMAALTQIVRPGHPYPYGFGPSITEMKAGHDLYYTLDKALWKAAHIQLGRSYRLPVRAECGGTMTFRYDPQNGAEGILFMLTAAEADILSGIGSCYNAVGMSAEMMIIQTAWLDAVRHLRRGIATDDLHLGLESIRGVGPGGNYLMDELTIRLLRSGEFFNHPLLDYSGGFEDGRSLLARAHERVEEMTAGYESPVPGKLQEDLRRYFAEQYHKLGA
jgi:trimethylamine---corrinoid protein Co-methyltransferase